jgi:hypothetical protein
MPPWGTATGDIDQSLVATQSQSVVVITRCGEIQQIGDVFTQPAGCSTRWALLSVSGDISIRSGNYAKTGLVSGLDPKYWRSCYQSSAAPYYSSGVCFEGQTPTLILQQPGQHSSLGMRSDEEKQYENSDTTVDGLRWS